MALRRLFPNLNLLTNNLSTINRANPIITAVRSGWAASTRSLSNTIAASDEEDDWYVRDTDEGYYVRMEMEGLEKADVKVSVNVEENTLSIKGEGGYCSFHHLPEMCKTDAVKAEMHDGVLKVVVPKIQEEKKMEIIHVKID